MYVEEDSHTESWLPCDLLWKQNFSFDRKMVEYGGALVEHGGGGLGDGLVVEHDGGEGRSVCKR